jgi:hypothetical protein
MMNLNSNDVKLGGRFNNIGAMEINAMKKWVKNKW